MNAEQKTKLLPDFKEDFSSQFGKGCRIDRDRAGENIYIYDPTGTKRWYIQEFVMEWEKKKHRTFSLQGQTYRGTWHTLMAMYQAHSSVTGELLGTSVGVDVLDGSTDDFDETTPNHIYFYNSGNRGNIQQGWGGGYYGKAEVIADEVKKMHALAVGVKDLPKQIDVNKTVQRLAETFRKGSFEPPQFVLPEVELNTPSHKIDSNKKG